MHPRNILDYCIQSLTVAMISLMLLTLFTGSNGQTLLQYLSVHSRFHTGYYDHFHSCHACGDYLVWKNEGKSVGGYSNSSTSTVISNYETTSTGTIVNSSILLTSNTYNNSLCLSSLLIITSINGSLSSDVTCNSWNTYENIIKHSDYISQKRSANGSIVIDYIFAEFIETAAYSLAYHGVMCKTLEPIQLWLVNNHTIHVVHASTDNKFGYHFVMNKVKYVIVLLNKTSAEFISFLSVSYTPPKYPSITVVCTNGGVGRASVTLLNVSYSSDDVTSLIPTSTEGSSLSTPETQLATATFPADTSAIQRRKLAVPLSVVSLVFILVLIVSVIAIAIYCNKSDKCSKNSTSNSTSQTRVTYEKHDNGVGIDMIPNREDSSPGSNGSDNNAEISDEDKTEEYTDAPNNQLLSDPKKYKTQSSVSPSLKSQLSRQRSTHDSDISTAATLSRHDNGGAIDVIPNREDSSPGLYCSDNNAEISDEVETEDYTDAPNNQLLLDQKKYKTQSSVSSSLKSKFSRQRSRRDSDISTAATLPRHDNGGAIGVIPNHENSSPGSNGSDNNAEILDEVENEDDTDAPNNQLLLDQNKYKTQSSVSSSLKSQFSRQRSRRDSDISTPAKLPRSYERSDSRQLSKQNDNGKLSSSSHT